MYRARRLATLTRLLVSVALVALGTVTAQAATLFDPALKFRVLKTPHFRIYFHQREDRLATRLGVLVEEAWRSLERPLGTRPPPLTHIVLADQTELANGYATPLPYNTIVIFPTWPRGAEFNTDDWLRLVVTHEFTHIVHLDRSEHWAHVLRRIFGRTLIAFPNLFLPTWQIEGLATFEESAITGEGRLHAGDFRAVTEEAARHGRLEPLDRVNGGLTDWPSGQGPYAYGVGFHQYLADRFGPEKLGALAEATARRLPYMASPVFKRLFGESLGTLWADYEATLTKSAPPAAGDSAVRRLTHHGFVAAGPRFDRVGGGILYSKRTADAFPTLERIDVDGRNAATLATRYLGATVAPDQSVVYFDQLEVRRNTAVFADIYALDRRSGDVARVPGTHRLRDPDAWIGSSPQGPALVAVREGSGRRELVGVAPNTTDRHLDVTVLLSELDTQFNAPRWSPDKNLVAVERHRLGHDPEVVLVALATRGEAARVVRVFGALDTRIVMPAWRPDGRAIVAAVAKFDDVFNLYEFPVDGSAPRQLTHLAAGAIWPDVSPDGRTLTFVGYTTAGYDVFTMPYPATTSAAELVMAESTAQSTPATDAVTDASDYSPLPTLRPTAWEPVIESDSDQVRIGAAAGGRDVLGYHSYVASATWLVSSPSRARTPNAATPDWFASYAYDRWRPTLYVSTSSETSFFAGPPTDAGTPSEAVRRERQVQAGMILPVIHARQSHTALLSVFRADDRFTLADREIHRNRTAVRGGWRTNTAKTYGYSISAEDGITFGGTVEAVRRGLGASEDATTLTIDGRAFLRGAGRHHVVALRAAGGRSVGDPIVGRTFLLGGPGPDSSVIDFGSGAISLLRGFGSNSFAATHVALLNAEYRAPLARPQRGYGTWPIFVHTLHAAGFVDAGQAWTDSFDGSALKTSAGAELSANLVVGFYFPFTVTAGFGWGHDGSGTQSGGAIGYFRVGKAF